MRNLKTLLSIVLPVRNENLNLIMVCESISRQQYKDFFEIILVDDSDLQYEEYVSKCIEALSKVGIRVKYLRGSGTGVGDAMLIGLKASKGVYVFFLDADNMLIQNFMSSIINYLKRGAFVSFLSKSVFSREIPSLFYAEQVRAVIRRGLRFSWNMGFVNTLYIWRKDILSRNANVVYPKISLLDQVNLRNLIKQHAIECESHIHIDEVLVVDIRYTIEDFNLKFLSSRLSWYYYFQESLKKMLRLRDVKLTLVLPIILAMLLVPLLLTNFTYVLYASILYTSLLITTVRMKPRKPLSQIIIGIIWLPILMIIKSVLTYILILQRLTAKLHMV